MFEDMKGPFTKLVLDGARGGQECGAVSRGGNNQQSGASQPKGFKISAKPWAARWAQHCTAVLPPRYFTHASLKGSVFTGHICFVIRSH